MLSYAQAIGIGFLQGITELFPVSSLGHSVLLPSLLGWHVDQSDPFFLTFLVATHTATALVLFLFFSKEWGRIIQGVLRSLKTREIKRDDHDARLGWLLLVGTIPAGIVGVLFEQRLRELFAQPRLVAGMLMFNGLMLFGAEILRRRVKERTEVGSDARLAHLSWMRSLQIGCMQCIALIPGFSRTGSTITGGLLVGLSHEDAARFSFLLATPIILAASLLKLPDLATQAGQLVLGPIVVGALCAGLGAYGSVRFLTKYFETEKLSLFALYCTIVGICAWIDLSFFVK